MLQNNSFGARSFVHPLGRLASLRRVGSYHLLEASHPCEDFVDFAVLERSNLLISIVGDGVGSKTCPLARFGSQLSTLYILRKLFAAEVEKGPLSIQDADDVVRGEIQKAKSRFNYLSEVWTEIWGNGPESDPENFRNVFGTTLLVLIVGAQSTRMLHVGDGLLMTNNSNGSVDILFTEPESDKDTNATRSLFWNTLLAHDFPKQRFLSLCTDGLERIREFNDWAYDYQNLPSREEIRREVIRRSSAHGLSDSLGANLQKLIVQSPINATFDDDDGAIAQIALRERAESTIITPFQMGVEYVSNNIAYFGSRSPRSFARSITMEFGTAGVICSVFAYNPLDVEETPPGSCPFSVGQGGV